MTPADAARMAALYSFAGPLQPPRLSWAYRVSLLLVAVAMLLLPLIYAALVAASAWSLWYHLTRHWWLLQLRSSFAMMAYGLPGLAGIAVTFFLIKPIFARPRRPPRAIALTPDEEPELFAFIDQICDLVGAPRPVAVHVDCQVNASAGFATGAASLVRRRLVLTIGLPLAAGLSVRELSGVLAHEFGHFAQGHGLRFTILIRAVNAWFWRVVYERDTWDLALQEGSRTENVRIQMVFKMCAFLVWLSRRLLEILMMLGHAISGLLSRQMELDADGYEVRVAGSEAFASTMQRVRELRVAAQACWREVDVGLASGTRVPDVPACVMRQLAALSPEVRAAATALPQQKASYFDTHPRDVDRHAAAVAAGESGVLLGGAEPASALFRSFSSLADRATRHHYEHRLGTRSKRTVATRSRRVSP